MEGGEIRSMCPSVDRAMFGPIIASDRPGERVQ